MIKKILEGFLFGVGLSVAIIIFTTLSMKYIIKDMYEESLEASGGYFTSPKDDPNLLIEKHVLRKENKLINIYGTIVNKGKNHWSNLNIQVELFDETGEFVHECEEYLTGNIGPDESENFVVSCGGCKDNPVPEFKDYKISIKSGFANIPGTKT